MQSKQNIHVIHIYVYQNRTYISYVYIKDMQDSIHIGIINY